MSEGQVVGIDIGTSRCRAVLYDTTGRMIAESTRSYPILNPQSGWQEQDPDVVLKAFVLCLGEIVERADRDALLGIGLSSYFNSFMAVDHNDRPLTKCIIWTDTRSRDGARRIAKECNRYALYHRTGCPIHPMYSICRARWLRDQTPSLFPQTHKAISIKEYIVHEVFGEYMVDWSIASGSGLFNIHTLQWDEEAIELAGLAPNHLSTVTSPLTRLPPMQSKYADMLGLADSIPIIIGSADGLLSNLGVGAVDLHEANSTAGTGAAVRVMVPEPRLDEKMRTWCYVVAPNKWAVGGITVAGLLYEWYIREFGGAERQEAERRGISLYQLFDEYTRSVPLGSDGLVFLPFMVGTRTPSWNPDARGVLFGLTYHHTGKHIVRALIEGVDYNRFSALRAVEEVVGGIDSVRVSGGFVASRTWLQITADVFGRELLVPEILENTAWGAAFMAMLALGLVKRLEDVKSMVTLREVVHPDLDAHERYQRLFARYNRLCQILKDEFVEETSP